MMWTDQILDWVGRRLAGRLRRVSDLPTRQVQSDPERLKRILRPADVILIEGCDTISSAIKYLTQSTWSHAALYVGDALEPAKDGGEPHTLVEVNLGDGCISAPLSKYRFSQVRICRPVNLTAADRRQITAFMVERIGLQYDMRNVIDLVRYLLPNPPVPTRWRRKMLALGSGDPTRAICSTLIAQAFQYVRYPVLPQIEYRKTKAAPEPDIQHSTSSSLSGYTQEEILHIRSHSLFAPRDFDVSPYFQIVKPTIEEGFNYKGVMWADDITIPLVPAQASGK